MVEANAVRVLFVEDDKDFREALAGQLSDLGFAVQGFADGAALLATLDSAIDADVIVLDWSLPSTSGIDLLTRLRRRGITLPVVFLTGHSPTSRESLAFERGAIDFIDKARGVDVLVSRLKLVVEGAKPAADPLPDKRLVFGNLVLRPTVSRAYWNDVDLGLTVSEYNIVQMLASNAGRHVTYRALYDRVHYQGFMAGRGDKGYRTNVRSVIKRIRNKVPQTRPDLRRDRELHGLRILLGEARGHRVNTARFRTWIGRRRQAVHRSVKGGHHAGIQERLGQGRAPRPAHPSAHDRSHEIRKSSDLGSGVANGDRQWIVGYRHRGRTDDGAGSQRDRQIIQDAVAASQERRCKRQPESPSDRWLPGACGPTSGSWQPRTIRPMAALNSPSKKGFETTGAERNSRGMIDRSP